jgi:16S rRNA (cytosine967-C5)-methyltransferase
VNGAAPVPLWRQLHAVAAVLQAVREGRSWTTAQLAIDSALRPGVQALSFAVLRHYGSAMALRALLAPRAPSPAADALLCSVLALALASPSGPASSMEEGAEDASDTAASGHSGAHFEAHTLVNQAVEAAKRNPATKAQASFINACLRRFLREREALLATALRDPQAQYNHPLWWIKRLKNDYPTQWQAILQASASAAPLTLRVNTLQTSAADYQAALLTQAIEATPVAHNGLELARSAYVPGLPGYAQGWFSVQDAAAQCAAPLLLDAALGEPASKSPRPLRVLDGVLEEAPRPLRVLDACAAPGGKTAHLLEYAASRGQSIEVVALDIDAARCQRIHDNLARLQLTAQVIAADAAKPADWWDGQPFDAILLDAPCSASGIVRRHPDIRWLRRESDIAQLGQLQSGLLKALWPVLKQGGHLLYCTCSVFKAEGQGQIQTFVAHHSEAVLLPSPGHLLPQSPPLAKTMRDNHLGGHDGFFYALLRKT